MPTRKLPLSSNPEWVALPADFDTPFTPEQDAAFYAPGAERVLSRMLIAASHDTDFMRRLATQTPVQPTLSSPTALEKAGMNA